MKLELSNPKEIWNYIQRLGPQTDHAISENKVPNLDAWEKHYSQMFKCDEYSNDNNVDDDVSVNIGSDEPLLNQPITIDEVNNILHHVKNLKACGIDNIPNEI